MHIFWYTLYNYIQFEHLPLTLIQSKLKSFRCLDCPLLDNVDEEITDEEMEMLVNMDYDDFEHSEDLEDEDVKIKKKN